MAKKLTVLAAITAFAVIASPVYANTAQDCKAVLVQDYYSYAMSHGTFVDFLASVSESDWESLKQGNSATATAIIEETPIKLSDDWNSFQQKRHDYLSSQHYTRTESEAVNIVQRTTSSMAYAAFNNCMATVSNGISVNVVRNEADRIELQISYKNPSLHPRAKVRGFVTGGHVTGVPAGHLWRDETIRVGTNETLADVVINADHGADATEVLITADDGLGTVSLEFKRADAQISVQYRGSMNIFHMQKIRTALTPDNNFRRSDCVRYDGLRSDGTQYGRVCASKNPVELEDSAPYFFQSAVVTCVGGPCAFRDNEYVTLLTTSGGDKQDPSAPQDTHYVEGGFSNFSNPVTVVLTAQELEHIDAADCGGSFSVPVVTGASVVLEAPDKCVPLAHIEWTLLPSQSTGVAAFDSGAWDSGAPFSRGAKVHTPGMTMYTYTLNH